MKHLALVVLALAALGCTLEATLRARSFQGPYETRSGGPEDVTLARALLAEGRPDAEVLGYLQGRGLTEKEARAVLTLAYVNPPCPDCGAKAPKEK